MIKIFLSLLGTLIFLTSCDFARVRQTDGCMKSSSYGGPYKVLQSGWNLTVKDLKTGEEKKLPNDNTWLEVDCF